MIILLFEDCGIIGTPGGGGGGATQVHVGWDV